MNRKTLVIFAGIAMLIALLALTFVPAPQSAVAQGPTPAPVPPVAKLEIVAMPGDATLPGAITATVKYITETNSASSTVALYTNGLTNAPINVPVYLKVSAEDPKNSGTATWTITAKPVDSKAVITNVTAITTAMVAKFTPDVVGAYMIQVTLKNAAGATSVAQFANINAGTYIGVDAGNCKQCHPAKTAEWAKTGHALVFQEELDNMVDGPRGVAAVAGYITHYSETCTRCHTTGWYPAPYNGSGGYWDAKAKANWTFPTWKQIDEVFTKKAPSNWAAAPAGVKSMGVIGCEVCHGPANEHVKNGAKVMAVTFDGGVCNQCHAAAANHSKGLQLANAGHGDPESAAFGIEGAGEQQCVRCHTPSGFASFLQNPKNPAAWSNEGGTLECAGCHDPHADTNPFQLRVVGKPVEVASLPTPKDVGLSASCETCHNTRRNPADAVTALAANANPSYPHYSSAAELLSDTGGITYGATVPNSPHGLMVGAAPVSTGVNTPGSALFKWSSVDDKKGNTPGPCVFCHMWDAVTTAGDPLQYKVGGHSFNTVTPDGKTDYGSSCKSCHGDVKDFNMKAKADYDGNGKVEGDQDEIKGLLDTTWKALEAKGWKKNNTGGSYADIPTTADAKQKAAWYNFRTVYGVMWGLDAAGKQTVGNQGAAAAIHNFKRSCALLQLSLKDLGALPAGAGDCTK
jgi:hypothetical protein